MRTTSNMAREEIKEKYLSLRETYRDLVGTLYPSIAYKELMELREEYVRAGGQYHDLPFVGQPHLSGHANTGW